MTRREMAILEVLAERSFPSSLNTIRGYLDTDGYLASEIESLLESNYISWSLNRWNEDEYAITTLGIEVLAKHLKTGLTRRSF